MRLQRIIIVPGLESVRVEGLGCINFRDGISADLPDATAHELITLGVATPAEPVVFTISTTTNAKQEV